MAQFSPSDARRVEVVANNLPLFNGAQLTIDSTLVSALRRDGSATPAAASTDGAAASRAEARKRHTYPELCGPGARARLVVLALEVGNRWSAEAVRFVRLLARAKARNVPTVLRRSAHLAWQRRWMSFLAFAAQRAFAASLLEWPLAWTGCHDGDPPPLSDDLAERSSP